MTQLLYFQDYVCFIEIKHKFIHYLEYNFSIRTNHSGKTIQTIEPNKRLIFFDNMQLEPITDSIRF